MAGLWHEGFVLPGVGKHVRGNVMSAETGLTEVAALIERLVAEQGFEGVGTCPTSDVGVHEEVRQSCASGKCPVYGKSWACPPACGDIYDFERQMREFSTCMVVQTVGQLEDDFDGEAMMEASELQLERFYAMADAIDEAGLSAQVMMLAAGTCKICKTCTYPDAPCRFPDKRMVSMEAAGLLVSDTCTKAGVPYNHGPLTIAYSSCILYN